MKRKSFEQQSVLAYMERGETYAEAKARLDRLWSEGKHPSQLKSNQKKF